MCIVDWPEVEVEYDCMGCSVVFKGKRLEKNVMLICWLHIWGVKDKDGIMFKKRGDLNYNGFNLLRILKRVNGLNILKVSPNI